MIQVKRFGFNTTRANCYVVSDETKECVIIDPCAVSKYERNRLVDFIHKEDLKPVRCLLTHAHYDHLLSCDQVRDEFGLLPEVHKRDELWMKRVERRIEDVFGEHYLEDREVISFGSHHMVTIHTPGHSPGSVVFYCEEECIAFTGDTLFRKGVGRSDLLFGWEVDLMNSLKYIVNHLPDDCVIYPGHDLDSTIGFEKKNNPFLLSNWYKIDESMKHLVVLTGAGISADSGLGTFRDKGGLWNSLNPEELASIEGYRRNREKVLGFYNERRKQLFDVQPNHAHRVIAELEKDYHVSVITMNVDDLHERAGSTNVLHLHGELKKVTGSLNPNNPECIVEKPLDEPIMIGEKASDGSQLRPFIVLFGETVPNMLKAEKILNEADIFVIIGSSLMVYPAVTLLEYVKWGIPCYVINPGELDPTTLYGFEHIKTTAVEGVDILKEKLAKL